MKKQSMLLLALTMAAGAKAQSLERQIIGSSGSSFSGSGMQVDYTVGEIVTSSGTAGSFTVNQGFHQNNANTSGIKESAVLVNFSLYPNPAKDIITLTLNTDNTVDLKLSLVNVAGQVLLSDRQAETVAQSYKREISIQEFATGSYFLNLYDNKNGLLKSIPFVKQ